MEKRLESEKLTSLVIPVNQFRWFKKGKEILWQGRHFDVKALEKIGDNYHIAGLFDEKEDALEKEMNQVAKKSASPGWKTGDLLFQVLFSTGAAIELSGPYLSIQPVLCIHGLKGYIDIPAEVPTPPPLPGDSFLI